MRRSTVLAILACCIACLTLAAQDEQETKLSHQEKLAEALRELRTPTDYRWLLDGDPNARQRPGYEELNAALAQGKIATSKEAEGAAFQHVLNERSGLLAQESVETAGLLRLGRDVPGFGNAGDFVWVVRFVDLLGGVTQEFWANAANGNVRTMLPLR